VEELLFAHGVIVTYEAIRPWCRKFWQLHANQLRRRRHRPGYKWHLDEMFLTIRGERHYLWRAVDQDGHVLDILVQRRRDKAAAKKFFRKLLKGLTYVPWVIITDQLKSYGAATRVILPSVNHWQPATSIIVRRTCISPRTSGNGACSASNPPGTPNASWQCIALLPHTSVIDATGSLRPYTAKRWLNDSRFGGRSQARR
jgi:hypothetical protein